MCYYIIMYWFLFIYFIYFNLQFIFDICYKTYQLKFLESLETNVNMNYFMLFNFFHFILLFIRIYDKQVNSYYLEYPIRKKAFNDVCKKIKNMSKLWLEQNSSSKFKLLVEKTQHRYFWRLNNMFELYGSIIRVLINIYIIYTINPNSIYIMLGYFIFYVLFYKFIVLKTRTIKTENGKKISKYDIENNNLYLNYFNSCIGNYQDKYTSIIQKNTDIINKCNYNNTFLEKIWSGTLQLFQKILMCSHMYYYLKTNCLLKCSLLLWPLYNVIESIVYQYEYILHTINYGYLNDIPNYFHEFEELYKKDIDEKKNAITIKAPVNNVQETIYYKNRTSLQYNLNLNINYNKILIEGITGLGKSTLCKIMSGYFNSYQNINSERVLYIPQDIYLHTENRTLYNVITQNDYNINKNDSALFYYIIDNLIPFSDIIESFEDNFLYKELENKSFSGGQEKRIYLAMWIYYLIIHIDKYDILIMDEPDKSLDNNTVNILLKNLLNEPKLDLINIIVISHNITERDKFNKIYSMIKKDNIITLISK